MIIHSSMKSIGDVEGGADTVIDAFKNFLAKDGVRSINPTNSIMAFWKKARAMSLLLYEK